MTVSAGQAAPGVSFAFTDMAEGIVDRIDVVIPNGHANLTGLRVYYANNQVIPFKGTQYLSGNNRRYSFDVEDFPTGQGWGGLAFNTDKIAHTFRMLFYIDDIVPDTTTGVPPAVLLPLEP